MTLNLYGTQNVIKLCRGMKHLEVSIFLVVQFCSLLQLPTASFNVIEK